MAFNNLFIWAFKARLPKDDVYTDFIYQGVGVAALVKALNHAGIDCRPGRQEWVSKLKDSRIVGYVTSSVTARQLHKHRILIDRNSDLRFIPPSRKRDTDTEISMVRWSGFRCCTKCGDVEHQA